MNITASRKEKDENRTLVSHRSVTLPVQTRVTSTQTMADDFEVEVRTHFEAYPLEMKKARRRRVAEYDSGLSHDVSTPVS